MTDVNVLLAETRSRVSEIAAHVARLPTADEVPDETYVKVLSFLQRTMQKSFQLLGDDNISQSEMMLLHDIRGTVASLFACSEIMNEQCADQLNAEQKEPVRTIKKLSNDLLAHLNALAAQDAQFD